MNAARILAELAADPDRLGDLPEEDLPEVLAACERLRARVWMRLNRPPEPSTNGERPESPEGDRMLTVEDVADRLSVSPDWLYRRSDSLPFVRKLSDRTLRFSEQGLNRWLGTRKNDPSCAPTVPCV